MDPNRYEEHDENTFWSASTRPTNPAALDLFSAPATNAGFTAAASSSGGRGVPPPRGSGRLEGLDLNFPASDLHFGMSNGERLRSVSAGAVGEADVAGGRRGAIPSRAACAACAATATRTGLGGAPAGTAARLYRAPGPARAAAGPPVGRHGGVGGGAGVAAGGPFDDDGALRQESQGHAEWRNLENGPPECVDDPEVMFEHTAADGSSSCFPGEHISDEGDDGGDEDDESDDGGDESEDDGGDESDDDGGAESEDDDAGGESEDGDAGDESDDGGYESPMGSTNLKRQRNSSSSASSARKRERREMVKIMKEMLELMKANSAVARKVMLREVMSESIKKVMRLTVECGAVEGSVEHFMATKLFVKAGYRDVFFTFTTNEARLGWLQRWCHEKKLYSFFGEEPV